MKRIATIAALACSLALAGPALAQKSIYDQNYEYRDYETTTSGTVDSFRVVNLRGQQDDHVIVRVQPHGAGEYEFAFVHLGPRNELRNQGIRVYSDQDITAHGQMGRIDGRPVLFADRVVLDDERIALGQPTQTSRDTRRDFATTDRTRDDQRTQAFDRSRDYQRTQEYEEVWPYDDSRDFARTRDFDSRGTQFRHTGDLYVVRGEVESVREFDIADFGETHRLIKITDTTRGGAGETTYIVDLGPTDGPLADMELDRGDRVMVQGHAARIEGRPVLEAVQIAEVFATDDEFAQGPVLSNRLRRDSPEPSDSPSRRVGKPEHHDLPSRTSSDLSDW